MATSVEIEKQAPDSTVFRVRGIGVTYFRLDGTPDQIAELLYVLGDKVLEQAGVEFAPNDSEIAR